MLNSNATYSRHQIDGVDVFPSAAQVCTLPDSYHDRQDQIDAYVRAHQGLYPEVARDSRFGQAGPVNPTLEELGGQNPPQEGVSTDSESSFYHYPRRPFVRRTTERNNLSAIDVDAVSQASSTSSSDDEITVVTRRRRTGMSGSSVATARQGQTRQQQRRVPTNSSQQSSSTAVTRAPSQAASSVARGPSARQQESSSTLVARASSTSQTRQQSSTDPRTSDFIGDPVGEQAIIWILQAAERTGWHASLAYGARGAFLRQLLPALFSAQMNGPLAGYHTYQVNQLMRKVKKAESYCREKYWNRQGSHSADTTGAEEERIPHYAQLFKRYFQWEENQKSENPSTEAGRQERRDVERSLTGQMAPLGEPGQELRTERSNNNEARIFAASRDLGQETEVDVIQVDSQGHTSRRAHGRHRQQQPTSTTQGQSGRQRHQRAPRSETRIVSRRNIESLMRENNLLGTRATEFRAQFSQLTRGLNDLLQLPSVPIRPFGDILDNMRTVELRRDQALHSGNSSEVNEEERLLAILQVEIQAYEAAQRRSLRQFNQEEQQQAQEQAHRNNSNTTRDDAANHNDGSGNGRSENS